MRILVINGNPKKDSFCRSLAERYLAGGEGSARSISLANLGDMEFDPILRDGYLGEQVVEPDLKNLQKQIAESDHIVFVYPNWWGVMPALLKGVLDRLFVPGFAFDFDNGKPVKLLKNKSATLLITMDVPVWLYRWIHRSRGTKLMKNNVLDFCGIELRNVHYIGPVHNATDEQKQFWLSKAETLGRSLA